METLDSHALDTFWYFINERHGIYLQKAIGELRPWTKDPILREWKFCNIFRRLDRTSNWLIKNIIEPHTGLKDSLNELLFNIFVFRAFNWVSTFEALGWQTKWDEQKAKEILGNRVGLGEQLISGAYMIRGYEAKPKWVSIPETLTHIYNNAYYLTSNILQNQSLEWAQNEILRMGFWGWGPFTTYQAVLDFTYTPILSEPKDINAWCCFGPGAARGLKAIWPEIKPNEYLPRSRWLLAESRKNTDEHVPDMTLQDIEFSLCEVSKYLRIESGGRGSERYVK